METVGFIFGMSGLAFALIAWERIVSLKKEFEELKKNLKDSDILITPTK